MKLRDVQAAINREVHRVSVFEDLLAHLQVNQVVSPIEDGVVPSDVVDEVVLELRARIEVAERRILELEEIDVRLPDPPRNVVQLPGPRRSP